jgi:adenylate kinase family enzyme
MKIHIIGPSGSGKTYLARELSAITGVPATNLDDIFWDNRSDSYGLKRPPAERDRLLEAVLENDDWIIEGVYYKWLAKPLRAADRVLFLHTPYRLQVWRIVRRFVLRKIGRRRSSKKETLKSVGALLKWNRSYNDELEGFFAQLALERRVDVLRDKKEVSAFICDRQYQK